MVIDVPALTVAASHDVFDRSRRSAQVEKRLAGANAKIGRLVAAIADGGDSFPEIKEALLAARLERDRLIKEQREMQAVPVVALHPQITETYRRQVSELTHSLTSDEETTPQARSIIRSLIDQGIVTPVKRSAG